MRRDEETVSQHPLGLGGVDPKSDWRLASERSGSDGDKGVRVRASEGAAAVSNLRRLGEQRRALRYARGEENRRSEAQHACLKLLCQRREDLGGQATKKGRSGFHSEGATLRDRSAGERLEEFVTASQCYYWLAD